MALLTEEEGQAKSKKNGHGRQYMKKKKGGAATKGARMNGGI
jgi:hypothetical protein